MTHLHALGADHLRQPLGERPLRSRRAAEEVETERPMLGERVYGEVRFGEEHHPRDPTGRREDVPLPRSDRTKPQLVHHSIEQAGERRAVGEAFGIATERLDDPLVTVRHVAEGVHPCAAPHSGQNFAARAIDLPQLWQNFVPSAAGAPASGSCVGVAGDVFCAASPPDET